VQEVLAEELGGAGGGDGLVLVYPYYPPNKVFFSVFAPVSKPCDVVLIPEYVTPVPLANVLDFFFIPSADTSTGVGWLLGIPNLSFA
jgi:hypothetical protein